MRRRARAGLAVLAVASLAALLLRGACGPRGPEGGDSGPPPSDEPGAGAVRPARRRVRSAAPRGTNRAEEPAGTPAGAAARGTGDPEGPPSTADPIGAPPEAPGWSPLRGLEPIAARARLVTAPLGLEGEPGAAAGVVEVLTDGGVPRELEFRTRSVPPGALRLGEPPRARVRRGQSFGLARFLAVSEGRAVLELTLLAADGTPTDSVLSVEVEGASGARSPTPRVDAWFAEETLGPGAIGCTNRSLTAARGEDAGTFRIGRSTFAGLDREATVVRLETEDPDGVLAPLPSSVAIPAGALSAPEAPRIVLRDAEGLARLRIVHGATVVELHVTSVGAGLDPPRPRTVPQGARALLIVDLARVPRRVASLEAISSDPGIVVPLERIVRIAGARPGHVALPIEGVRAGTAELRLRAEGLPEVAARVDVVPADVTVRRDRIEFHDVGGRAGRIGIRLPPTLLFARPDEAPALPDGVRLSGYGTTTLTLRFEGGAVAELVVPVRVTGTLGPDVRVKVSDSLWHRGGEYEVGLR